MKTISNSLFFQSELPETVLRKPYVTQEKWFNSLKYTMFHLYQKKGTSFYHHRLGLLRGKTSGRAATQKSS